MSLSQLHEYVIDFLGRAAKNRFADIIRDDESLAILDRRRKLRKAKGIPESNLDATNPVTDFCNSFIANVFKEPVTPLPGSVVLCSLVAGIADHSGIYCGNNRIIELHGNGEVIETDFDGFLYGQPGDLPVKTGISIYVACEGMKPLALEKIRQRAEKRSGEYTSYNLALNNCHDFTSYCLTGRESSGMSDYDQLLKTIGHQFGVKRIEWRVLDSKACT